MKKNIAFLVFLVLIFSVILIAISNFTKIKSSENNKIEVIATLFPQYDFVKQVGGDKVNVTLLLPPGVESHTYEPTPQDMFKINNSKLFIYTGKEMEPWADNLISGMKDDINVLDLSTIVKLINVEEFEEEYCNGINCEHEHHDEHESSKTDMHEHSYDPHIWLNPLYAIDMVKSIEIQLSQIDPDNAEYYRDNARNYINQIQELDNEFQETVDSSQNKKIAFGGAFAYAYFVERYNLEFVSAYQTCGESAEPSTSQLKSVIDYINSNKLPVVFYKEYSTGNVAKTISESTNAQMLVFNTVHNVSKDELDNGATYVSIMKQNLENLKCALK